MSERRQTRNRKEDNINDLLAGPLTPSRKSTRRSESQLNTLSPNSASLTEINQLNTDSQSSEPSNKLKEKPDESVDELGSSSFEIKPDLSKLTTVQDQSVLDLSKDQLLNAQNLNDSNSKIVTRRRSSNILNQLRSGSSSSMLSQSLNLGKSKI